MTSPAIVATRLVTQRDLAAICNVSLMTVSNALRGAGRVRPKVAAAIIAAAHEHGYSRETHFGARALQQRRHGGQVATKVICAVVREIEDDDRLFNGRILRGIEVAAAADDNELIIAPNVKSGGLPRVVTRRQVDGLIWLLSEVAMHAGPVHSPVPWVSILYDVPEADTVLVDNREGGRQLGEHLAALGHRCVAFVGSGSSLGCERLAGLRAGLAAAGGRVPAEYVSTERHVGTEAQVLPLLRRAMAAAQARPAAERFTALAVYNDHQAGFVIRCLEQEFGWRGPQDLSVTGFDGLSHVPASTRRLTTAALPLEELGATANRLLTCRLAHPGRPRQRRVLAPRLVVGDTTTVAGA